MDLKDERRQIEVDVTGLVTSTTDLTLERDLPKKRMDYIDWHEFFMATAFLAAMRSKDPCSQVGACIVNKDKKIVGIGYNGMPIGCSDDEFPWIKGTESQYDSKYFYVCHAEMNAIVNKNESNVKNCTIYVGLFPCNECAKIIIQSGIREVIYRSDKNSHKEETKAAKRMFNAAGIKYWQYTPKNEKLIIDFSKIAVNGLDEQICPSS